MKSVDSALRYLFNVAAKSPQSVKQIFFTDGSKIDARSIHETHDYDNSRIPTEHITLARNTIKRCYDVLDDDKMAGLLFLYYYGYLNEYAPQIIISLQVFCEINPQVALEALRSYRDGETDIAGLVGANLSHRQAEYQINKAKQKLSEIRLIIWKEVESILYDNGYAYLMYDCD